MTLKPVLPITLLLCLIILALSLRIEKNAYSGVCISFSDQIKEQHFNFDKFKQVLQKSSEILYHATRKRAYFEEFTLILPSTWTRDICTHFVSEFPDKMDIYVTNSVKNLVAQHSKGCGEEGEMVYVPLEWLNGDTDDLGRQFIQQWSVYRYGVFEENPLVKDACYVSEKKQFSPAGCYDTKIFVEPIFSKDGIAICELPDEVEMRDRKSSLMFKTNLSKALDFCDGSSKFPHNPVMPSLHNNLCDGKTVWSIIENSNDFKHGKNLPSELPIPQNIHFKCFQEHNFHLNFVIQTSSTDDITTVVEELRYTLYHFIRNFVPKDASVNLVTFSDDSDTTEPVKLNLKDNDNVLYKLLDKHIETRKKGSNACLICGIQKALNVTKHSTSTVVIIAFESAVAGLKISELMETMQNRRKPQLNLILIKDTAAHEVPMSLLEVIRSTGGSLHSVSKPYLTANSYTPNILLYKDLNIILSTMMKSPLQVDDKVMVVHEATYTNSTRITDIVTIPPNITGKLLYIMHCDLMGQISYHDSNCNLWDEMSTTFKCGSEIELNKEPAINTWQFQFDIRSGVSSPVCTSVALLLTSATEYATLRGWLNKYIITPGKDYLIIYAELIGKSEEKSSNRVFAEILGPESDELFAVELFDNGNGDPDVRKNDGIYSRYFTEFKDKGLYGVTLTTKFKDHKQATVVQKKSIGSFSVISKPTSMDITPPNRVADLKVIAVDHEISTVTLQWTAPGNDMDFGKARTYEIKSASHPSKLTESYFEADDLTLLKLTQKPKFSGSAEIHKINLSALNNNRFHYIALRAKDTVENKAKISNIIQVYIIKSNIIVPEHDTSTIVTSSVITITNSSITEEPTANINKTAELSNTTVKDLTEITPTANINFNNKTAELSWEEMLTNDKFIILTSSFAGILLVIMIINIIIWCCCFKKERNSSVPAKGSLKPPYNLNIAYHHESQSLNPSVSDLGGSLSSLRDQSRMYSTTPTGIGIHSTPNYSYHTSKSLLNNSQSDSELGFKVVETMPAYATRSLSRFAQRLNADDMECDIKPSGTAQPQQPSNTNGVEIYSLGVV